MASWVPEAQARTKPPRARSCPPVRRNARACLPAAAHAPGQSGPGVQPSRPLVSAPAKGWSQDLSTPASAAPTPPARSRALLSRLYLWWWRSCLVRAAGRALVHGLKPSRQGRSRDGERAQKAVLGEPGGRFTSDQGAAVAPPGRRMRMRRERARGRWCSRWRSPAVDAHTTHGSHPSAHRAARTSKTPSLASRCTSCAARRRRARSTSPMRSSTSRWGLRRACWSVRCSSTACAAGSCVQLHRSRQAATHTVLQGSWGAGTHPHCPPLPDRAHDQ